MSWFYIFDSTDGRLVSGTSIDPGVLPAPFAVNAKANRVDVGANVWDETLRDFIVRPPHVFLDRSDDIIDDPRLNSVSVGVKNQVRNVVDDVLGSERWRKDSEAINIGGSPGSNSPPK